MKITRPLVLIIMDGWGIGENDENNPIYLAPTPNIDHLLATYPHTIIGAAGTFIGMPPGHQGSSEMGHLIIGAGRNVLLPQMQVRRALETGEISKNKILLKAFTFAKKKKSRLHLMGLLSNFGVHSYDEACHKILELAVQCGIKKENIFVHVFADGRDAPPQSVEMYVRELEKVGIARIATIMGRWWAMDRDHRWERVSEAYKTLVMGQGQFNANDIHEAIEMAYKRQETDEFIRPTVIDEESNFRENDVVINYNFRVDRAIEITQALIEKNFKEFARPVWPKIYYVAMSDYYEGMPCPFIFKRPIITNTLGEVLSREGLTQFRCTETEKWPYMTTILNGLREEPFPGETQKLIPSDKVPTYDLAPEMQAIPIAKEIIKHLHQKDFDAYFINFANPDILGHTGVKEAIMKGVQTVDTAVGLIYQAVLNQDGIILITADHGDAEICWDRAKQCPHTHHTDNFVPFIYIDEKNKKAKLRENGALADIAPTILKLLNLPVPKEMIQESLILGYVPHSLRSFGT